MTQYTNMTPKLYETSLLCLRTWQAAKSDNIDELRAIACVLRNRVLRYGKTYSQVCEEAEINQAWPAINHPALIDPTNGLLSFVEGVYDNSTPDMTSNHLRKNGALYFGRPQEHQGTGDWFEKNILTRPEEHVLIGVFGKQHFYE